MSYYLKYRPRLVSELDLARVREAFLEVLKSGKVAHAYLLVGPRGSGKTSAARIMAKVVNCEKNKVHIEKGEGLEEPCLTCESCKAIEKGGFIDVLEIDAASNRGIDAIRELRDKIGLAPVSGARKVYIVDEVHMLTSEAFNALLKTLEEPPAHAMFFLCTTDEHKVPETVMSRCVRVGYVKGDSEEIRRSLSKAIEGEKLTIEEEALSALVSMVDGGFREGHKLLEQAAMAGEKITLTTIEKVLGLGKRGDGKDLLRFLLEGETKKSLEKIGQLEESGADFEVVGREMLDELRKELKAGYGIGKKNFPEISSERVKKVLMMLPVTLGQLKNSVAEALAFEVLAIEVGNGGDGIKVEPVSKAAAVEEVQKKSEKIEREEKEPVVSAKVEEKSREVVQEKEVGEDKPIKVLLPIEKVIEGWGSVVEAMQPRNHGVAGLLRATRPKEIDGGKLVLEVFYKFHKDQLEQEQKRLLLEEVLYDKLGIPGVRCILSEKTKETLSKMESDDNVEAVEDKKVADLVGEVFGV